VQNSLREGKYLILRYTTLDITGIPVGLPVEIPCMYVGGLELNLVGPYQDRVILQFIEYLPPSLRLAFGGSQLLPMGGSSGGSTYLRRTFTPGSSDPNNGAWRAPDPSFNQTVRALCYDRLGHIWHGGSAYVKREGSTIGQVTTNNPTYALAVDPRGNIYAGGAFTTPQTYMMKYDGASWTALAAGGPTGQVNALAIAGPYLLVAGSFTTPSQRVMVYKYASNAPAWLLSPGGTTDNSVNAIAVASASQSYFTAYFAGDFGTFNGLAATRIAKYVLTPDGATTTALGSGINGSVYALAIGPDGRLYAGGVFTLAGGVACNNLAVWNGTSWASVGNGVDQAVYALAFDSDGVLYIGGSFRFLSPTPTLLNSNRVPAGYIKYDGQRFLSDELWLAYASPAAYALLASSKNETLVGGGGTGGTYGQVGVINYTGTADTYPRLVLTGNPSNAYINGPDYAFRIYSIRNATTGKALYFDLEVSFGEVAILDLTPGQVSFTSSLRGDITGSLSVASDVSNFSLVPGLNHIAVFCASDTSLSYWPAFGTVELQWEIRHHSIDASGITP
jgi:hypothetical protein